MFWDIWHSKMAKFNRIEMRKSYLGRSLIMSRRDFGSSAGLDDIFDGLKALILEILLKCHTYKRNLKNLYRLIR
jgi:hypothetical protein